VHTDSVIQLTNTIFNNLDNSVYIGTLCTVSTDNPVKMLIFLNYSLVLCLGNVCNSNVTMKFARLHYFLSQNVGETKDIMSPSVQKLRGTCPPMNSVPIKKYILWNVSKESLLRKSKQYVLS